MKLFVGNLPWSVTDQDLEEMFAPFGAVGSAKVITDRDTGRSRGFGFVEMSDDSARNAIADLNESEISGRKLTVNEARDRDRGRR
ncbi:MAG TPA: RNA-binding protein [Pseudomonadales bacterium]|jgi:RNA recognition motif-containing protein